MDKLVRLTLGFLIVILCAGCAGSQAAEVGYHPSIIPVRISINTNGEVNLSFSDEFVTPIGVFDFGAITGVASFNREIQSDKARILVVRVDGKATVYHLENDKDYDIKYDAGDGSFQKVNTRTVGGNVFVEIESKAYLQQQAQMQKAIIARARLQLIRAMQIRSELMQLKTQIAIDSHPQGTPQKSIISNMRP